MKTQMIVSNQKPEADRAYSAWVQKGLLACGIASSLTYVTATIVGAMVWKGYNAASQAVSELSAIGAPSRPYFAPLLLLYSILVLAFGVGVWRAAGQKRILRIFAGLIIGYGVICMPGPLAPMHQRGETANLTDTLHIILTAADALFIVSMIGFGAAAFKNKFRIYSIATLLLILGLGVVTSQGVNQISTNLTTPGLGTMERILIFSFMLWAAVLSVYLLRLPSTSRHLKGKEHIPHAGNPVPLA